MTARPVNRTMLGSNGQLGIGDSIMMQEKARYEEFRRQHAKQNRDLVRVNTQRLEEIQNLKAEKDGLQAIILEERAEKAALASELKTLKQEVAQVRSNSTREALDAILAVVPTLRQLREKLDNNPASLFEQKRLASVNRYVRVDSYEDRQFVAASGQTNLADLTERTERETESDSGSAPGVLDYRTARGLSISASPQRNALDLAVNRRRSVTAQERPTLSVRAEESPACMVPISLQMEAQPAIQPRNRRISGTRTPRMSSVSPEGSAYVSPNLAITETVPDVTSTAVPITAPITGSIKRQRTSSTSGKQVVPRNSSPAEPESVKTTQSVRPRISISAMVSTAPARGKKEEAILQTVEQVEFENEIQQDRRQSVDAAEVEEANLEGDEDGENGGRQTRRARKSVNYKEPSLHTKMRKPDGKLVIPPTSATKSRTPSRHRSQSAETPTPTPHIPALNFAVSAAGMERDEALTGLMRLQEKLARNEIAHQVELTQTAVRRKSVLPKSGRDGIPVRDSGKVALLASRNRTVPVYNGVSNRGAEKEVCPKDTLIRLCVLCLTRGDMVKDIKHQEEINSTAQFEATNVESTSSRRRLAQLSINTVPISEERTVAAMEMVERKIAVGGMDCAPILGEENAADSVTLKAKLGRRRSSLFKPTDM
ncbi:hypothetical protein QFC21_000350 [Naganishia friedmannii]|uniref:Uncharacterized protein n=1 Tax=Naganishia friedmannii TaxID=89922 RepID=A0ACC2WCS4_9TREE|nr:hypothetical protein QFC21_000350 [Naganishia friedmannii]